MLAKVSRRTRIVYLANPNNPTGTYLPFSEVKRLHAGLPPHALLVLDAAYAEYVTRNDYAAGIELAASCDNVVMTRTFSKDPRPRQPADRLVLRLGACGSTRSIGCERRSISMGRRSPPGVASLEDAAHIEAAIAHNARWLPWLAESIAQARDRGHAERREFPAPGVRQERRRRRAEADAFLSARGFILRAVGAYGLPDCLRLTVGGEEANRGVVAALTEFMRGEVVAERLQPPLDEPFSTSWRSSGSG